MLERSLILLHPRVCCATYVAQPMLCSLVYQEAVCSKQPICRPDWTALVWKTTKHACHNVRACLQPSSEASSDSEVAASLRLELQRLEQAHRAQASAQNALSSLQATVAALQVD